MCATRKVSAGTALMRPTLRARPFRHGLCAFFSQSAPWRQKPSVASGGPLRNCEYHPSGCVWSEPHLSISKSFAKRDPARNLSGRAVFSV